MRIVRNLKNTSPLVCLLSSLFLMATVFSSTGLFFLLYSFFLEYELEVDVSTPVEGCASNMAREWAEDGGIYPTYVYCTEPDSLYVLCMVMYEGGYVEVECPQDPSHGDCRLPKPGVWL